MKFLIALILSVSVGVGILQAQQQPEQSTVYLKQRFFGSYYVKNGVEYRLSNLGNEMSDDPEAAGLLKSSRKYFNIALVFDCAGLAACVGALYWDGTHSDGDTSDIAWGAVATAYVCIIPAVIFAFKGSNSLQKCIWVHNNNVMRNGGVKTSLLLDPMKRKAGLGLNLGF